MGRPPLIALMGLTGTGKSAIAESVADKLDLRLINADASLVYRGFNIGTAKPTDRTRYELIDICEPDEEYSVGRFLQDVESVLWRCLEADQGAMVVGGTGLYIRALMDGYSDLGPPSTPEERSQWQQRLQDEGLGVLVQELQALSPETAAQLDLQNPVRVIRALIRENARVSGRFAGPSSKCQNLVLQFNCAKFGLIAEGTEYELRLKQRIQQMLADGWKEEVRALYRAGWPLDAPAWRAIGYLTIAKQLQAHGDGGSVTEHVFLDTRRYAKRQRTWLKREKGLVLLRRDSFTDEETSAIRERILQWVAHQSG